MYELLYSILNPLIVQSKNGHLTLTHENGMTAKLAIQLGRIIYVETGTLKGSEAVQEVAMWIFFDHQFVEEQTFLAPTLTHPESKKYLAFLAKVEKQYIKIREAVPFDDYLFKFLANRVEGKVDFKQSELQIALALDGKTTLRDIAEKTQLSDLLILSHVFKMVSLGLVQKVSADNILGENEAKIFIAAMTENLAGYIGPAVELVVDEVFQSFESTPEMLKKSDIPQLIVSISEQLEGEDSVSFKKWGLEYIRKIGV